VFLGIAQILTPGLFAGQVVAKFLITILALGVLWLYRRGAPHKETSAAVS
jgi:hypothetical protein